MKKIIPAIIICIFLITGCSILTNEKSIETGKEIEQEENDLENSGEDIIKTDPKVNIDLNLKPNEAGKIMTLMYHNVGNEEKEWVRTPENFLKDMNTLYEKGYRPISLGYQSRGLCERQYYNRAGFYSDSNNL